MPDEQYFINSFHFLKPIFFHEDFVNAKMVLIRCSITNYLSECDILLSIIYCTDGKTKGLFWPSVAYI